MKLPIKKKYFDKILNGTKHIEIRDAHITFVCEETGETLKKNIEKVKIQPIDDLLPSLQMSGMFENQFQVWFGLGESMEYTPKR